VGVPVVVEATTALTDTLVPDEDPLLSEMDVIVLA
jgi:hypothetical protein